ncbi:unnamed protein product [Rhizophagus irregularis]|nr:unnamed protein product [Rhizophagus irregularis]
MRERELPIRSESSNIAMEGEISQINALYDPMELNEININDVDSDTNFNNKQMFSFLVKNPRNLKQKQSSSHVSFTLVVTEQLLISILYNSEEEQATNEDEDIYFNEDEEDDDDLLRQHVNFDTPEYDGEIKGAKLLIPDINAGFTWIVYWIFKYQERYRLPDTAGPRLLLRYVTDYLNHPMSNLRSYCNNIITKQIPINQGMMFKPSLIFPIISIKQRLQQLYNTKGFEKSCRKWINQPNNEKELADIFDERI